MCVAYSVIDVQLELEGAAWDVSDSACKMQSSYTHRAANTITFAVGGLQVHSSAPAAHVAMLVFSLVTISTANPSTFSFQNCHPVLFPYAPSPLLMAKAPPAFPAPIPRRNPLCSRSSGLWCATWRPSVSCLMSRPAAVVLKESTLLSTCTVMRMHPRTSALIHTSHFTHTHSVLAHTPYRRHSANRKSRTADRGMSLFALSRRSVRACVM